MHFLLQDSESVLVIPDIEDLVHKESVDILPYIDWEPCIEDIEMVRKYTYTKPHLADTIRWYMYLDLKGQVILVVLVSR